MLEHLRAEQRAQVSALNRYQSAAFARSGFKPRRSILRKRRMHAACELHREGAVQRAERVDIHQRHKDMHHFLLLLLWLCIGCSAEVSAAPPGAIVNVWAALPPPSDSALPGLDEVSLFERVTDRLEDRFVLPRELRVLHLPCGTDQAFYDRRPPQIRICDELLEKITHVVHAESSASEEDQLAQIRSTLTWMFLHEVGHAFIHIFDLPVLGREEDAADGFAALALVDAGGRTRS
jgi:hypothetical protein